ncbi:MAG: hypothetical protein AVDCRST_MAG52-822, partial [uncultured Blastococcus sp.]
GASARRQLRTAGGSRRVRRLLPGDPHLAGAAAARAGAADVRARRLPRSGAVGALPGGRARLRLRAGDGGVAVLTGGPRGREGPRQLRDRRGDVHALRRPDGEL